MGRAGEICAGPHSYLKTVKTVDDTRCTLHRPSLQQHVCAAQQLLKPCGLTNNHLLHALLFAVAQEAVPSTVLRFEPASGCLDPLASCSTVVTVTGSCEGAQKLLIRISSNSAACSSCSGVTGGCRHSTGDGPAAAQMSTCSCSVEYVQVLVLVSSPKVALSKYRCGALPWHYVSQAKSPVWRPRCRRIAPSIASLTGMLHPLQAFCRGKLSLHCGCVCICMTTEALHQLGHMTCSCCIAADCPYSTRIQGSHSTTALL